MNLKEILLSKQLPIQYRFYNLVTLLYTAVGIIACIVCAAFRVPTPIVLATIGFAVFSLVFCALAHTTGKYDLWAILFYISVNMVIMPLAYFNMGGFRVGGDVWLVAGAILGVFTLSQKAMYVLLSVNFIVDMALFFIVYQFPNTVRAIKNEQAAVVLIAITVLVAAVGVSLMLLYKRREYEDQLRLNEMKERELQRLIDELQKAREHADQINDAKTGFLKGMSNGVHAPLSMIMEKSHMLMHTNNAELNAIASEIYMAGKMTVSVISNIVDLSMIESGDFYLNDETYSLKDMLAEIYQLTRNAADKKQLRLVFDVNEYLPNALIGDNKRIRQILLNLLSNAVQYTAVGEVRLTVACESVTERKIKLRFSVSDTGIGIKKEDIDTIFYRFNSEEKDLHIGFAGAGLGLTVSNQILQLMDSSLEVKSEYGQGSVFSFLVTQRISNWEGVGSEEKEVEKDSYEEFLAADIRRIKEDIEGEKRNG